MFSDENKYEQIDRYLLGEMNDLQKEAFEEKIANDDDLSDEISQQKIMLNIMDEHESILSNKKNNIPNPENNNKKRPRKYQNTRKNRILSTLGIASSISIITFISTLYITNRSSIKFNLKKNKDFAELENRTTILEHKIKSNNRLASKSSIQLSDTLYILQSTEQLTSYSKGIVVKVYTSEILLSHTIELKLGSSVLNRKNQLIGIVEKKEGADYIVRLLDGIENLK